MGDLNQKIYLEQRLPEVSGRVLEVGSKNYGNTASLRDQYGNCEYIGVDFAQGEGVDQVIALCEGSGVLALNSFDLIICYSVLEHVKQPWLLAANLYQLLGIGGLIYISVPWVWRYHPYPDDYFRFSWRGCRSYLTDSNGEISPTPPISRESFTP